MENSKAKGMLNYTSERAGQSYRPVIVSLPSGRPKPKLLDQVRQAIRTRHYSPKTEESLHEQSHGESFLALFQNRLSGDGLLHR